MNESTLYQIDSTNGSISLSVIGIAKTLGFSDQYISLTPIALAEQIYLLGHNPKVDSLDVFQFTISKPFIQAMPNKLKIGVGRDIVNSFVLGNQVYLMAYTAKNGVFDIYSITGDLLLSAPIEYFRNHEPGLTQGFTTVKGFTCFNQVVLMGYNGDTGYVAMYTIGATATSPKGVPPVVVTPAWVHQWAHGWTRFAFFRFAGETFFLKTNTWKPNVNIDHVHDALNLGTVEVGTNLTLADAQELNNVEPFTLGGRDPHFVTYLKSSGNLVFNKFNSDGQGWTSVANVKSQSGANLITPITTSEGKVFLLVA